MLLEDVLKEYLYDCQLRKLSERTMKSLKNNNKRLICYLAGEFAFSPSGSKLAIGYGEDAMRGTNDAVIVDVAANKHSRASERIGNNGSLGNIVRGYLWLDDDTLLLHVQ